MRCPIQKILRTRRRWKGHTALGRTYCTKQFTKITPSKYIFHSHLRKYMEQVGGVAFNEFVARNEMPGVRLKNFLIGR